MRCKLHKIEQLSGDKTSVYSVSNGNEKNTLFDLFLQEFRDLYKSEIIDILKRLKAIGKETGAREHYFKMNEGSPGDGVCALFDLPGKNLRLYCIRYGTQIVILGDGGVKAKSIRSLQEDLDLKEANYFLRKLSNTITQKIKEREITYSIDGLEFRGALVFDI